jgi:hypothetical protein
MVLTPWKLYSYPDHTPLSPHVGEISSKLAAGLQLSPSHFGLAHLHVHFAEMGPDPTSALPSCLVLSRARNCPHLLHMISHIDVLLGDYDAAVSNNSQALAADQRTMSACPKTTSPSSFFVGYIAHDYHMKCFAAMLGGYEAEAKSAALGLQSLITEKLLREVPFLAPSCEAFVPVHFMALLRFGRWEEVLAVEASRLVQDPRLMAVTVATLSFARAVALAATDRVDEALREEAAFRAARLLIGKEGVNRYLHNNECGTILDIEASVLRGEVLYADGQFSEAFASLREAVRKEGELCFDEPWGTMIPARHPLGALLLHRARANLDLKRGTKWRPANRDRKDKHTPEELLKEAEAVYRADLELYPKNPWGLTGLVETLEMLVGVAVGGGVKACGCDGGGNSSREVGDDEEWRKDVYRQIDELKATLAASKSSPMYDYKITSSCACGNRAGE